MEVQRRNSKKRDAIRAELCRATDHPSAEELFRRLRPQFPDLSLGTVYRNLALFLQEGSAICVGTVDGQDRFDGRTDPHAHFICEKCARVIDLPMLLPEDLLCQPLPGIARDYSLSFYGVCNHCA